VARVVRDFNKKKAAQEKTATTVAKPGVSKRARVKTAGSATKAQDSNRAEARAATAHASE
jgi:hypothetical protein